MTKIIVNFCKVCGAPIYAQGMLDPGQVHFTEAVFSCRCCDLLRKKLEVEIELLKSQTHLSDPRLTLKNMDNEPTV